MQGKKARSVSSSSDFLLLSGPLQLDSFFCFIFHDVWDEIVKTFFKNVISKTNLNLFKVQVLEVVPDRCVKFDPDGMRGQRRHGW